MSQIYLDGRWYVAGFRDARRAAAGLGLYRFEQIAQFCAMTGRFHDECEDGQDWAPGEADVWILQGEKEETTETDVALAGVLAARVARMTRDELQAIEGAEDHPLSEYATEELDLRESDVGPGGPFDEPEDTPCLERPWWESP